MRLLGVDYGKRRLGLALSDGTAVLARPWQAVEAGTSAAASAAALADLLGRLASDPLETPVEAIVVGLPHRLNGSDTDATAGARELADAIAVRTGLPVFLQDERLSSHAAEALLSARERDWRKRKAKIDAAAAAVILQDFLDGQSRVAAAARSGSENPD